MQDYPVLILYEGSVHLEPELSDPEALWDTAGFLILSMEQCYGEIFSFPSHISYSRQRFVSDLNILSSGTESNAKNRTRNEVQKDFFYRAGWYTSLSFLNYF